MFYFLSPDYIINWLLSSLPIWVPWAIVGVGAVLFIFEIIFNKLIPFVYRLPIRLIAIVVFALGFYLAGRQGVLINGQKEVEKIVIQQQIVTKKVVKYVHDKVQQDKKVNDQIIATEITKKDDHMCDLPMSFVRVYNDSAKGAVSGSSTGTDGTSSGIALSEAEDTIAKNNGTYHKIADQLRGFQMWAAEQKKASP
jgi:hypothetical protein